MGARLGSNSYGKSRVRMLKVRRAKDRHEIIEVTVAVALEGDFAAAHVKGDNAAVLPTDTMKNTVYALGQTHVLETIESFALHLGRHFVTRDANVSRAGVSISERLWRRVRSGEGEHPHAFISGGDERRTCEAGVTRMKVSIESGIDSLVLLKTTDSAFAGFKRDEFTTLKETDDRILSTSVAARWAYRDAAADFAASREAIRRALIETFAAHKSESVQQTLYAMGERALGACAAIDSIRLSLPNRHYLLADLSALGMKNDNEVFVPTHEPHGLIEATVERS